MGEKGDVTVEQLEAQSAAKIIEEQQEQIRTLQESLHQMQTGREYAVPVRSKTNVIRFGVCSDLHFGSRYCREDALQAFYDMLHEEKVPVVLCVGDILDGHGIYRGQEFEQSHVGLSQQLSALEEKQPQTYGIETYFITGNHDYSFFKTNGAEPWDDIAGITGWEHVGIDAGNVRLQSDSGHELHIGLIHPDGGTAYALSYRPQKLVESIPGGQKPHVLLIGHYHKAEYIPRWRNVAVFQAGAFQSQTPFLKRKGSDSHVGGWIVEAVMTERELLTASISGRFTSYYEPEAT